MDTLIALAKVYNKDNDWQPGETDIDGMVSYIYNLIIDYYANYIRLTEDPNLTNNMVEAHDKTLTDLYKCSIVYLAEINLNEHDINSTANSYCQQAGLADSGYYMGENTTYPLERLERIATKELISFGLLPNPGYSKIFNHRTIYYGDTFRNWVKGEILDIIANINYLRRVSFNKDKGNKLEYAFGLLVTINMLIKATETKINTKEWLDI